MNFKTTTSDVEFKRTTSKIPLFKNGYPEFTKVQSIECKVNYKGIEYTGISYLSPKDKNNPIKGHTLALERAVKELPRTKRKFIFAAFNKLTKTLR